MRFKRFDQPKLLIAITAGKWFLSGVPFCMNISISRLGKRFITELHSESDFNKFQKT
jgi:hypothetical protein